MVEAVFPNPKLILRPGQYGRIRAVTDVLQQARLVPQRAVQELQGQHQVWVLTGAGRWAHNAPGRDRQVDVAADDIDLAGEAVPLSPLSVTLLAIPVSSGEAR